MQSEIKNILCIGAGYVGGPTMAVIADKCPQYKVTVVDIDEKRIAAWNSDKLPIFEPGLFEVVSRCRGRNLFYSTDIPNAIKEADVIFIAVNTPTKTFGTGKGQAANLQYFEATAREIAQYAESDKIIVEKSTLPVRTAEALANILRSNSKGAKFHIVSNPEFLAEGTAIRDLQCPDRVLIGGLTDSMEDIAAVRGVAEIYANWVPADHIITTNLWSSELTKLVANALLAQRISSINSISALCEKTGADVNQVSMAVGKDTRIGQKFLKAGIGFGGSCFKKDILNLVYLCNYYGLPEVAEYWSQVVKINDFQAKRFVATILRAMFNSVAGKKVAILGFAFKADTGDTRESPAITVCKNLLEEHAILSIYDPKAMDNAKKDLAGIDGKFEFADSAEKAAEDADAIVLLTDWKCFRDLDYTKMYEKMKKPAFFFDGRNVVDPMELRKIGFNVYPIGSSPLTDF